MSQSGIANLALSGGGSGVGVIDKILGDTGSITGNTVTIYANNAVNQNGASVSFVNSGTVSTLYLSNPLTGDTFLGLNCGTHGADGNNVGVGENCLQNIGDEFGNTAVGALAANKYTGISGQANNCFFGFQCATNLLTGHNNTIIGALAGNFYTSSESGNILLGSQGVIGDTNVLRIGIGTTSTAFIAGIAGVTVSTPQQVTINPSTGQLGVSNAVLGGWTDTSGTVNATSGNGYFITATSTSTLPASPAEGDTISYIVDTASILTINANTGHFIRLASAISASGGTCASTARGNSITLVYRTSGTTWIASSSVGNWSIT
jgi:hypothetical protein